MTGPSGHPTPDADRTVVVNGRFLGQRPGGLQRTARSLLRALTVTCPPGPGLRFEVLTPGPDPDSDRVLRAPRGRAGGQVWEQLQLPAHARGRLVLSLANTAPLGAARSVLLVHDLAPLVGPQWFVPSMRVYGRLVLAAARRAEAVLTVSEQVAGELRQRGVRSVTVVPPAVDPLFVPAPQEVPRLRRQYGLDRPYVVLSGWADPRKDALTALAAHRQVLPACPHYLVLLGGTRGVFRPVTVPDLPSLRRFGHLPDTDLPGLLTGAAAVLYPSRYEGFGLPPLEAAACGTTALVSDLPVLRESGAGWPRQVYLPPGDASRWAAALAAALAAAPAGDGVSNSGSPTPPPGRTWADAAAEVLTVLTGLPASRP